VTAGAVLAICRVGTVGATGPGGDGRPKKPSLEVDGAVLTLEAEKEKYEPGEKPVVKLHAVSRSGEPRIVELRLRMMSRSTEVFSRMMPAPTEEWSGSCSVAVAGGESELTVEAGKALPAGREVFFTMERAAWVADAGRRGVLFPVPHLSIPVEAADAGRPVPAGFVASFAGDVDASDAEAAAAEAPPSAEALVY
jgi:hypothetical protein